MNLFDEHIRRINDKLLQVLKKFSFLQKENEKLKNELQILKLSEKEKDDQLQLLALRIDVLKASKGEMKEDEKKSFEKKINQYLKDVDKCIASLNE
ncbi:MAG: hypothetical protein ABIN89_08285 [Chitinophagaceae bacterium]